MKKIFVFFLFSFLCVSQNFNAGIIGGISTSQVSGDGLSGFNKIGPRIGLYVNREISWLSIQLELQYITKGSKKIINESHLASNYYENYNFHLDYIGIPIILFSNLTEKLKLELGTSINVLVNQKEEIDGYIDISRKVSRLENSILIGVRYELTPKYSINIRGSNSIFPIRKHSSGQVYQWNRGQHNTVLSFGIFYKL